MAKVLTIDDSMVVRVLISKALAPLGLDIAQATNGQEGLDAAAADKPDLIILDITMPVLNGLETLEKLRSDPNLKDVKVIMLTAESSQENVGRADQLGVTGYVPKPFTPDKLIEQVKGALGI